ncbi:MAG: M23 family metallopeptidase [Acidimicrobiales bacterium]
MIAKLLFGGLAVLATPLAAVFGLSALAAGTASASASDGHALFDPSEDAVADIPPLLLQLYAAQSAACPGLPWQVVAGIGKIESDHGRFGGATLQPDGTISPAIIGIPLNGTNGTARIPDTDDGRYDGDTLWDRAVGPFQFILVLGDLRPRRQPRRHPGPQQRPRRHPRRRSSPLPAWPGRRHRSRNLRLQPLTPTSTWSSNGPPATPAPSRRSGPSSPATPTPPLSPTPPKRSPSAATTTTRPTTSDCRSARRSPRSSTDGSLHPSATPASIRRAVAVAATTVIITGTDGATYTYCHLSAVAVAAGDDVTAGQAIGLSGGQPGAPGAGNTTGPHLHLGIRVYGQSVCPQPLLLAILRGTPIPPTAAPTSGCYHPGPATDWPNWLDNALARSTPP